MIPVVPPIPSVFQPGFVGSVVLRDFDAVDEVTPAWDHSHTQLGRGPAGTHLTVAQAARMELALVSRSPGVLIRGAPPRGLTVLAVNVEGPSLLAQRLSWQPDLLALVPPGIEFEVISATPNTIFALSVDRERLDQLAVASWGRPFPSTISGPSIRFRNDGSRRRLLASWARWLRLAQRWPGLLIEPILVARMQDGLLGAVVANVEPAPWDRPVRHRRDLALRTETFLRQSLEDSIGIDEICAATRASRQAVHRSFAAVFGTSPKAYRKSLRLSAARKDLERARRRTTVAEVATQWGFFRFGSFSSDYRAMFGEYPSETLRRAGGRAASTRDAPADRDPFLIDPSRGRRLQA